MDVEKIRHRHELWLHWRWLLLAVLAFAFLFFVVYYRSATTQSRWTLEKKGAWLVFVEKIVPKKEAALFDAAFPAEATAWYASLGIMNLAPISDDLVAFGAWENYAALGMDDRLIFRSLKTSHPSDLRLLSLMASVFKLNEPVAACFTSSDGRLLFFDLRGDVKTAVIHGYAHALIRRHIPPAVLAGIDTTKAESYDPRVVRAFRFLDEVGALFLTDLALSGATGSTPADLAKLTAFEAKRYAPEGPIFTDEELTFSFGADPRTPYAFSGAAGFALAAAKERGLPAMVAFSGKLLRGDYASLDELCATLGGRLPELLERYLGSPEIPE